MSAPDGAGAPARAKVLIVDDVVKRFSGVTALNGLSLAVEQGTVHSLIGPNGSGKTTLFNVVGGFYRPDKGTIAFGEQDITGWRPDRIAGLGLARTFQTPKVFDDMTVLENVMVGFHRNTRSGVFSGVLRSPRERREEEQIRTQAGEILAFAEIDDVRAEVARNLSYGRRGIVELATAVAMEPTLIMLDEPTAGLNSGESRTFIRLVKRLSDRGFTIFLVEHNMRVVMSISDVITVLDHGQKIAEGTPEEVQRDRRVVEAYLGTSGLRWLDSA